MSDFGWVIAYSLVTPLGEKVKGDEANNKKLIVAFVAGLVLTATCFAAPHGGRGAPDRGGTRGPAPRQVQAPKAPRGIEHKVKPAPRAVPRPAPVRPHIGRPALPPPPRRVRPRPIGARFWARPPHPPPLIAAYRTWTWVDAAWEMYIDGIFCYGEGYYYDGFNYYYNGACYTRPPTLVTVWP